MGIVDASLVTCLAWIYHWSSNERRSSHVLKNGNVIRVVHEIPESHSQIVSAGMKMPAGITNRVFHNWLVWDKIPNYKGRGEAFILAFAPRENCNESLLPPLPSFPNQSQTIVGKTRGIYILEKIASYVTRLTLVQQVDMAGSVPQFVMRSLVSSSLQIVQSVVDKFRRRGKVVDKELRSEFISKMGSTRDVAPGQEQLIARCLELGNITNGEFNTLKSSSRGIQYFQKYDSSASVAIVYKTYRRSCPE